MEAGQHCEQLQQLERWKELSQRWQADCSLNKDAAKDGKGISGRRNRRCKGREAERIWRVPVSPSFLQLWREVGPGGLGEGGG